MSLVNDIKTLVDEPGVGVFWSDQAIYDAANEALVELWASTKWATTTATLTLTASADLVEIPCTIMIPQYYTGTGGRYFLTTRAQAENWLREWKLQPKAYPKHLVVWDTEHVRPIPSPDATYTFTLTGIGWPVEINGGNLDVDGPTNLRTAIMYRAASTLLESTLPELADTMLKESMEAEDVFNIQLRNQQSHNIMRLKPATAFTRAQGGNIKLGLRLK
jgi:hypothetical protein